MRITGGVGEATLAWQTKTVVAALAAAVTIDGCSRLGVLFRHAPPLRAGDRSDRGLRLRHHLERIHLLHWCVAPDYRVKRLPFAILFFAMQRLFAGELTAGGVKG